MKKSENKIKKTILLTIESKGIKYFGINLTKEVQNYKTLLKEIKEDLTKSMKRNPMFMNSKTILLRCQYSQIDLQFQ